MWLCCVDMVTHITQVGSFCSDVCLGMEKCLVMTLPCAQVKYVPVFCGHEVLKILHKHVFQLKKSIETCGGNEFEKKPNPINNPPKSLFSLSLIG